VSVRSQEGARRKPERRYMIAESLEDAIRRLHVAPFFQNRIDAERLLAQFEGNHLFELDIRIKLTKE